MKRVLGFLKSFWLASSLLWLAGVVLCVWWVPRLGGSLERLAIAVALLTAVWLLAIVLRKYRKVRAERDLEDLVQLEVDREAADAATEAGDYEVLRERLKSALRMLRAQRGLHKGGSASLSDLPWYLVLGLSSSGKTSLLTRSGLSSSVAGLGGDSGTQYCDWYFGNDALMIDTAGRYVAEEQPARAFSDFLRLLARRRRGAPINGLVVVVDLPALLHAPRDENHALARQLIERINDFRDALDASPPVYLMFTKADQLPGFTAAFNTLDSDARHAPWGMTFSVAEARQKGVVAAFSRHFPEMVAGLRGHVEAALRERGQQADSELLHFPEYIAEMEGLLADFLEPFDLRRNSARGPLTRGIYFTSALQDGSAMPAILDEQVRQGFALKEPSVAQSATAASAAVGDRPYFVGGVFRDVMIPDRNLVRHYARDGQGRSLNPLLIGVGGVAGAVTLGLLGNAYYQSRTSLEAVDAQLTSLDGAVTPSVQLDLLHDELSRVRQAREDGGLPWYQHMGLDGGERLGTTLEAQYFATLKQQVLAPLAEDLDARLRAVGRLAVSLGIVSESASLRAMGGESASAAGASDVLIEDGKSLLTSSGERLRQRLTERPTLGSVPRSPGELASQLKGEADYRLRGGVNDAYWSTRQQGREALRDKADALRGSPTGFGGDGTVPGDGGPAEGGMPGGPAFSSEVLNQLTPEQVAGLIDAYDALKLYLILSDPVAHPDVAFVREALPRAWHQLADSRRQVPGGDQRIADNVALYSEYLEQGKAPALVRDEDRVARSRRDLKAFLLDNSPAEREYLRLRLAAEARFPSMTLSVMLPDEGARGLLYAGESVPAFFTRRVWDEFVRPELLKTLSSDLPVEHDWVLEDENPDAAQGKSEFAATILAHYKRDYAEAWERFLADVGVRRFEGLALSRQRLARFSDYQRSPLKTLMAVVDDNTRWDSRDAEARKAPQPQGEGDASAPAAESAGMWDQTVAWLEGSGAEVAESAGVMQGLPRVHDGQLADHFAPVASLFAQDEGQGGDASVMNRYQLRLRQLKVRLDGLERGDVGKRTKQLLAEMIGGKPNEISAARDYVAANVDTSQEPLVQSLQRLFRAPIDYSVASLQGPVASQLAAAWGEQVVSPWHRMVSGRYPVSDSGNETSVRDLRQFIDPDTGLLTRFDNEEVGNLEEGEQDGTPLVDPKITATITKGTAVGRVLESLADVENGFEIMIRPSSRLISIQLTLDGQQQVYRNGRQHWQRFVWPGDPEVSGARLDVVTRDGRRITVFNFPNRWSLLKLIESADVTDLDTARQRFTWYTPVGPVSFEARNFGGVKLTDLKQVRNLSMPSVAGR
ncbi:ImcF-like protein [Cobetia amphilecti]|nr:ImcF-like protein [Cobetia litoralis]